MSKTKFKYKRSVDNNCYFVSFKYSQLSDWELLERYNSDDFDIKTQNEKNMQLAEIQKNCNVCKNFINCSAGHRHLTKSYDWNLPTNWLAKADEKEIESERHRSKFQENTIINVDKPENKNWFSFKEPPDYQNTRGFKNKKGSVKK